MEKILKRFLTHYYKKTTDGTKCFDGVSVLAYNWKEAEEKVKIHNKISTEQLEVYGEWVEDIRY